MIEAAPAPVATVPKPSPQEVKRMHLAVKELIERLYKEQFDIDLVFDNGDLLALDRFLAPSKIKPCPTIAEVQALVRAYFASDGISGADRPYQWADQLGKYSSGPLDRNGVPKSVAEAQRTEVEATIAASIREAEERKAADAMAARERSLSHLVWIVGEDLANRGFETYKPVGAVSHIVAVRKNALTRNVMAMRIVCRKSAEELTRDTDFYQAIVSPEQDVRIVPVVYHPPLETE
jgi:hypothetical protein